MYIRITDQISLNGVKLGNYNNLADNIESEL